MDHKQLATPSGRRKGLLYPNRNSCSLIELPRKARFKEWLPYAPDAGAGLSQHSLQKSPSTPLFLRFGFVLARGTTTFARPVLRLDRAKHLRSSCCRYWPGLMLLRPRHTTIPGRAFPKVAIASAKSSRRPRAARKREPRTRSINQETLRQRKRPPNRNRSGSLCETLTSSQNHFRPLLSRSNVDSANAFSLPEEGQRPCKPLNQRRPMGGGRIRSPSWKPKSSRSLARRKPSRINGRSWTMFGKPRTRSAFQTAPSRFSTLFFRSTRKRPSQAGSQSSSSLRTRVWLSGRTAWPRTR